jgi:ATP-dependent helicase/nuclease subunit A
MAKENIRWTEQQRRAIIARGSDVLVSASAGTGKTAVLSGRCVDIVSDKSICPDVCSILVLTFTDAAAEQMRLRIAEQLNAAFLESGAPHLRHQLILLQGADISTIHSFCKRLITEYFYKLGIDPTFGVIDSDEQKLLKAEVLEKTIGWAWEQSNLAAGLERLFYRRDLRTNDGFLARIIETSDFLDGVVSREDWYERARVLAEAVDPGTGEAGKKQKQIVGEKLNQILSQLRHAQKLYENERSGGEWAREWEESFVKRILRCMEYLRADEWERCAEAIRDFEKSGFKYKPKGVREAIAELIQGAAKEAVSAFENLSELAMVNPAYLDKVGGAAGLQTAVLIELVRKFDRLYGEAKRAINCLDFADLEHYALKLLADESSSEDNLSPSETALALRGKYKYIFVDEYQDINAVQQAILKMLSSEGNVFVVGDVKQSIYAWRGAEPGIFMGRLKEASGGPGGVPKELRVDLNANFRSAKGILDFVNKVFSRIMTAGFAKIDYDESAKLKPAVERKPEESLRDAERNVVELHILDEETEEAGLENEQVSEFAEEENPDIISSRQRQAVMIAQRIRQMVGAETGKSEFQIYDKQQDAFRDVEYRDIVILMRSLAPKANDYVEVLQLAGVPVSCQSTAGYFETTEISDCLCLLKVLDNPRRDIEFAAVLRSPFFKISDTDLAKIKAQGKTGERSGSFYDRVVGYGACGADSEVAGRLEEIAAVIERWRVLARRGSLADLIWQIYRETDFLSFVSALPSGRSRRANLLKLHERAIQFEGFASTSGIASLSRFVEFIEKLLEAGQDWSPAEPEAAGGNAVRIISVHKSKGLEFPVVFLAELDSPFNKTDSQKDFLADGAYAVGLQIIDRESNGKLSSLAHQVIADVKLSTRLEEEMRILYVATTRARERLILTASGKKKHCGSIIYNGFFFGEEAIADWQLRSCRSALEWVLYGLCDQKSLHKVFETGLADEARDEDLFSVKLHRQVELEELSKYILNLKARKSSRRGPVRGKSKPKQPDSKLLSELKKSLGWQYRFGEAVLLPAKRSVTQLTHRNDEYVRIDYSRALDRKPRAVLSADLGRSVDGRLIGTATHLVIARLDLGRPVNREAVEKVKEKLLADGAMSEAAAECINAESIVSFFESEPGRMVLDTNNVVWREWPFTFALPASFVARDSSLVVRVVENETVIVQGIIDMLVQTADGLVVIDFKTDNITAGSATGKEVSERAELYREQLELYGRAAGAILKSKVLGKWLYFLTPGCAIEV